MIALIILKNIASKYSFFSKNTKNFFDSIDMNMYIYKFYYHLIFNYCYPINNPNNK